MEELFSKPLFVLNFLTGFIFIIAAIIQIKFPPKKINSFYGYRTKRSMASQEAWDYAQTFSSKLMLRFGAGLCLLSLLLKDIKLPKIEYELVAATSIIILVVVIMLVITEKELKKRF